MKRMKRTAIAAAVLVSCSAMSINAVAAENDAVTVYVTVSDDNGQIAVAQEAISVTDVDNDGALTINDALIIVHDEKYEGGASGFVTEATSYGLSITKLWGIENGGSYSYYLNNEMPLSLTAPVNDGDYLSAYAFQDLVTFSDAYSFFDKANADAEQGDEITLTLYCISFDENWNTVNAPVENAVITVNGVATEYTTDAEGNVTIKLEAAGRNVISAVSDTLTLVPPVFIANVAGEVVTTASATSATTSTTTSTARSTTTTTATANPSSPKTGDTGVGAVAAAAGIAVVCAFALRRRNED